MLHENDYIELGRYRIISYLQSKGGVFLEFISSENVLFLENMGFELFFLSK